MITTIMITIDSTVYANYVRSTTVGNRRITDDHEEDEDEDEDEDENEGGEERRGSSDIPALYTYHGRILIQRRRRRRRRSMVRDQRSRSTGFCWKGRGKSREYVRGDGKGMQRQFEEKKVEPHFCLCSVSCVVVLIHHNNNNKNHDNKTKRGTHKVAKSRTLKSKESCWGRVSQSG